MELLVKVVGVDNVVFASEMLGGVTTIDPSTGRYFDDHRPCLDNIVWLTEADRKKIYEENALKAYPRLAARLAKVRTSVGT
jgi:4-oxalmesaconate hydratase